MGVYKVPQDVEAEDKLLGPFSFRQFIYLIITVLAIAAAWGLSNLFLPLAILPLPVILFFGALALPLRKDQPMEVYLAAMVSFYLKPRKRLWQADGLTSLVEITAPKVVDIQRSKDISRSEAEQRLSYLANIVDSGGWSVRGVAEPTVANTSMNSDYFFEAQQTEDVLDSSATMTQRFDAMIEQDDEKRHRELIDRMKAPQPAPAAVPPPPPPPVLADPYASLTASPTPHYDPYPTSINQTVIQPLSAQVAPAPVAPAAPPTPPEPTPVSSDPSTSVKPVSAGIMNLANQHDLSIETIAHEANRIMKKEQAEDEGEVIISLR